jgi:nucleoside-diphosphate-sugar epimerase
LADLSYAVTGANGYVGSIIKSALGGDERVISLVRQPVDTQEIRWSFSSGAELAPVLAERRVDVLVHSAWDMTTSDAGDIERVCVEGSARLFEAARSAGVKRIVFISSISAFDGARSVYGQKKVQVEQMVQAMGGTVLRLGLVYSNREGGAFGNLRSQASKNIVPVINHGMEPQYLLSSQTLSEVCLRAARGDFDELQGAPLTLAHPQPWTFRELITHLAAMQGVKPTLVPVPWRLLYYSLRTAEKLGVKLPFRSDSVTSVVYADPRPDFSVMARYGVDPIPFPKGLHSSS